MPAPSPRSLRRRRSSNVSATALQVLAEQPVVVPVVLLEASAMEAIAALEAEAKALARVGDENTAQQAANALRKATRMAKEIEAAREAVKSPFYQMGKRIDEAAKAPQARIDIAKRAIQAGLNAWVSEQERKQREIEARRQREAEDLAQKQRDAEALVQREREEQDRLARDEAARLAKASVKVEELDIDEADIPESGPTEAEKAVAAIQAQRETIACAPVPVIAKPTGIQTRKTLIPSVVDVSRVPDTLLKPREADMAKIRATFCTGWKFGDAIPQVAGLAFTVDSQVISGR